MQYTQLDMRATLEKCTTMPAAFIFVAGNGSPMATNVVVVVVVVVVVGTCCCYQHFSSLKLFHFPTDRN